jgi:hypothetical protein
MNSKMIKRWPCPCHADTPNKISDLLSNRRRRRLNHKAPGVQRILDAMTIAPAYVRNGHLDVLAANQLGRAVFAPLFDTGARMPNIARFMFLDPAAREFYIEWDRLAGNTVALLRAEAGRDPHDRALSDLIGEVHPQ